MKPLTIGVDMDGILVDLMPTWLDWYHANLAHDDENVAIEDITRDLHHIVKAGKKVFDALNTPGWFKDLPELPGAIAALKLLVEQGHHVVICTSPGNSVDAPSDKTRWIRRNAPFLDKTNMIITHQKHLCCFDVLIDDDPKKIMKYKMTWPKAKVMGIAWPWNTDAPYDVRAEGWKDPAAAWGTMVSAIAKYAQTA